MFHDNPLDPPQDGGEDLVGNGAEPLGTIPIMSYCSPPLKRTLTGEIYLD